MQWFYVSERQERVPVPEGQLRVLAAAGILKPTTLLWREGLDSWLSAGEVKPEIFQTPVAVPGGEDQIPPEAEGLALELARMLRRYAAWLQVSGLAYFACGVVSAAVAGALGYFAAWRSWRLEDWRRALPEWLRPLMDHPWTAVVFFAVVALLLLTTGSVLIAGAARARQADTLRSREDLGDAVRAIGRFFQISVLSLLIGAGVLAGVAIYRYKAAKAEPPLPPPPPPERVSV